MTSGNAAQRSNRIDSGLIRSLHFIALSAFVFALTQTTHAQESWGTALFHTKRHDFGYVVLGADAEFQFELTNNYNADLRLLNVRSSCTCTSAKIGTLLVKPGETGTVIARLNTTGQHLRNNSAVLTVQMELTANGTRQIDTVQLFVSGYIRPDVVLTPGSVEFGTVSEGAAAERTLLLEYSGRPNWALMKVERSQPFIYAKAEEVKRTDRDVAYRITAVLRENAPAGYIRDVLRFTTNEVPTGKTEPVELVLPVHGVVTAPIRVKPSSMLLGFLESGESVAKSIIITSETPFRITNISSSDSRFRFAYSDQESTVQLISVSFSMRQNLTGKPLDIAGEIRISTNDSRQSVLKVNAFVRVMP